jgi:hypothetical protein
MITELEQKKLKALFKGHYTEDVLKILNKQHVLNKNREPHNAQYVRMVFQGLRNNTYIEAAIWQLATNRKQEQELQKTQKQKVFESKP